jgi:hypothetical protein
MVLARWCSSTLQPHNRLNRHPIPWPFNTIMWVHIPRSPEPTQTGLYLQHHPKEMIYTLRRFAVLHVTSRKSLTHVTISALQLSHILQKYKTLHITVHSGCTDHIMCITDCLSCDAELQGHSEHPIHKQKMLHYSFITSVKSMFSNTVLVNYNVSLI